MPAPIIAAAGAVVAPYLMELAKNGLSMLVGAIQAKGKEVVEEKLGVKIPEDPAKLTPDLLVTLQTKQMEHQEFLTQAALEETKAVLADVQSARDREVQIATSAAAPMINKVITPLLALLIVSLTFILYTILMFTVDGDLKPAQERIIIFVVGALTPICGQVVSYYFGSSRGDAAKDQYIREMKKNGPGS